MSKIMYDVTLNNLCFFLLVFVQFYFYYACYKKILTHVNVSNCCLPFSIANDREFPLRTYPTGTSSELACFVLTRPAIDLVYSSAGGRFNHMVKSMLLPFFITFNYAAN